MRAIREVREDELNELARITIEAFPGMKVDSQEARDRMLDRLSKVMKEPTVHFFGVFEDDDMLGVMRCYDFTMKLHATRTFGWWVGRRGCRPAAQKRARRGRHGALLP